MVAARRRGARLFTTPVALLAGFTLTSALVVVSQRPDGEASVPALAGFAAALLLVSSALFLVALVVAGWAAADAQSPGDVMLWHPEGRVDPIRFRMARQLVSQGRSDATRELVTAGRLWCGGVFLTGVGTCLALLSYETTRPLVLAAVVAMVTGAAVAIVGGNGALYRRMRWEEMPVDMDDPIDPRLLALFVDKDETIDAPTTGAAADLGVDDLRREAEHTVAALADAVVARSASFCGQGRLDGAMVDLVELHPNVTTAGGLVTVFRVDVLARWRSRSLSEVLAELGVEEKDVVSGSVRLVLGDTTALRRTLALCDRLSSLAETPDSGEPSKPAAASPQIGPS